MRIQIIIALSVLMTSAGPGLADPMANVLARMDALERRNEDLAKENADLKLRVGRLEAAPALVAAKTQPDAGHQRSSTSIVTTSSIVPSSARYDSVPSVQASNQDYSQPPKAFSWTGTYAGIHGGGGWGDLSMSDSIATPFAETFGAGLDASGGLGGIQIGANKQFGRLVAGAELSLSGARISGSNGEECFSEALLGTPSECETRVTWLATGLARLGYVHDRWLLSGSAGWSIAGAEHMQTIDAGVPISVGSNETLHGLTYGAGVNYALTDFVSFGIEYLHADLKANGAAVLSALGAAGSGSRELDLDIARAQLNVKLGGE